MNGINIADIVAVEVNGGYQFKFSDTEVYFGPIHKDELDAKLWVIQNLHKPLPEQSTVLPNPNLENFEGKQAAQEIKSLLTEINDKYPGAVEYINECLLQVPINRFYTKKERMYAQLKGIALHVWDKVDDLLIDHKFVLAVKTFRRETGIGLKESKDFVEKRRDYLIKQGKRY